MKTCLKNNIFPMNKVGAALAGVLATAVSSSAAVIVVDDQIGAPYAGQTSTSDTLAQEFNTGSAAGYVSDVSLTLDFYGSHSTGGTVDLGLYSVSGSGASTTFTLIGDLGNLTSTSAGIQTLSVAPATSYELAAHTTYAVEFAGVSGNPGVRYEYYSAPATQVGSPAGTFGPTYNVTSKTQLASRTYAMEVEVVPELPVTGFAMGFGGLAVGLIHLMRRNRLPLA